MSKGFEPSVIPIVEVERVQTDFQKADLGQWYWYGEVGDEPMLMCVMELGSNYLKLHAPEGRNGYHTGRVHRDNFDKELRYEPDADQIIQQMINEHQQALIDNMSEIQRLTESLGIAPQLAHQTSSEADGKAMAVLSGQVDVGAFEKALILAKQETLPALFKKNEKISEELARWMCATSMPMKAKLGPMKESVEKIEDRIFSIKLYSGLLETIFTLSEGEPAARDEKLRIMQRRLYCDEECLLDYESGGMEFDGMGAFDKWLAKPVNRNRILPFPRCMVSMRVRRNVKDRSGQGLSAFVEIAERDADQFTYLIVRNGENLYRVCTDQDFGEHMFPERTVYDPSEPLMMHMWGRREVKAFMPRREYDALVAEKNRVRDLREQWERENPQEQWEAANPKRSWWGSNPHHYRGGFEEHDWYPFDDSSTYFDLGMQKIQAEIKDYNRIALVVQGLFDRTETLIPHLPVQMWNPVSFAASVELIYDNSMVLHWGEAPDIAAYIEKCNAQATGDSVFFGQEYEWTLREAERENQKTRNAWRIPEDRKYYYKTLRPHGDPGPGRLAIPAAWAPRSKTATFGWLKESRTHEGMLRATIKLPLDKLFNVSAYKLGDFRQFFIDPRTRAKYLEWAPMLLSAEEYHLGKLEASQPVHEAPAKPLFRR